MLLARLPTALFGLQCVIFLGVGLRESLTGSLVGAILAWSLATLAFLTALSATSRR
jgi:hypothetical protein